VHPDKIHDPAQNTNATEALRLVNEAYVYLYKNKMNQGPKYIYQYNWVEDWSIDEAERTRRQQDVAANACGPKKPWFGEYKTYAECAAHGDVLCDEFWVNLVHGVVDKMLFVEVSDGLWSLAEKQEQKQVLDLEFYGPCDEVFVVHVPAVGGGDEESRWSYCRGTEAYGTPLRMGSWDGAVLIANLCLVVFVYWKVLKGWRNPVSVFLRNAIGTAAKSVFKEVFMFWIWFGIFPRGIWRGESWDGHYSNTKPMYDDGNSLDNPFDTPLFRALIIPYWIAITVLSVRYIAHSPQDLLLKIVRVVAWMVLEFMLFVSSAIERDSIITLVLVMLYILGRLLAYIGKIEDMFTEAYPA